MSKINEVVIYPGPDIVNRYSSWWPVQFSRHLRDAGYRTRRINTPRLDSGAWGEGRPFTRALALSEMSALRNFSFSCPLGQVENAVLINLDCSTPGMLSSAFYTHDFREWFRYKIGICHGTSFNNLDLFPHYRQPYDMANLMVYDTILVASEYHREKLLDALRQYIIRNHIAVRPPNIISMGGFPLHCNLQNHVASGLSRSAWVPTCSKRLFCIVDRNDDQKRTPELVEAAKKYIEKHGNNLDDLFGTTTTQPEFHKLLGRYQFLLVTAKEETFGYQVAEACALGMVPIVPDALAYREFVPRQYRYDNKTELLKILEGIFKKLKADPENGWRAYEGLCPLRPAVCEFWPTLRLGMECIEEGDTGWMRVKERVALLSRRSGVTA